METNNLSQNISSKETEVQLSGNVRRVCDVNCTSQDVEGTEQLQAFNRVVLSNATVLLGGGGGTHWFLPEP